MSQSTALQTQQSSGRLTLRDELRKDKWKNEIAKVLPEHVKPERMIRVALTALTRTPKLADCDQKSFFKCLMDLSQWGLEPDGRNAHLIPFRNNKRNITECQLIIDYKGFVQLAYRSGRVVAIHADVVREGDIFVYDLGLVRHHTPWFLRHDAEKPDSPGKPIGAYCHVTLRDDVQKSEVLSMEEVQAIRERSRAKNDGPWVTDFNEMAKKTAFRRIIKWIPISAELSHAVARDDEQYDPVPQQRPASVEDPMAALAERLAGPPVTAQDDAPFDDDLDSEEEPADSFELSGQGDQQVDGAYEYHRKRITRARSEKTLKEAAEDFWKDERLTDDQRQELDGAYNERLDSM